MRWLLTLLLLAASSAPALASGDEPAPALAPLLEAARTQNPALTAARARWMAAEARVTGAGLLPDPMVEVGAMNLIGVMGPEVAVSQRFPLGGKLGVEKAIAEAEAQTAHYAYLSELDRVLTEVKQAYYRLAGLQASRAIVARTQDLLKRLETIANTRYAVGQGKQADVLKATIRRTELMEEDLRLRQASEQTRTRLLSLVNRPTTEAYRVPRALPNPVSDLGTREALYERALALNPALNGARAQIKSAEAALDRAELTATPDVTTRLGVANAYMGQWQTVLGGMVGVSVPVGNGQRRERAEIEAATAALAAAKAQLAERERDIGERLASALIRARAQAERVELYRKGLLPQAERTLASEIANYQVGRSDVDAVLAAEAGLYRYQREQFEALADYHQAVADIEALTGQAIAELEAS